ncbi:hypothetical protein ACFL20_06620, partial [Spirochaetota bacterium]
MREKTKHNIINLEYEIKDINFFIQIYYSGFDEEIILSLSPFIKNALINIVETIKSLNVFKMIEYYAIPIVIKELVDFNGQVKDEVIYITNELIYYDLLQFESTLFHELIHFMLRRIINFEHEPIMQHLEEGIAYY